MRAADTTPPQREQMRAAQSKPIIQRLKATLEAIPHRYLSQNALGKAIRYTLEIWDSQQVYFGDGRIEIDNNLVENCRRRGIGPVAYLKDMLTRMRRMSMSEFRLLTPEAWRAARDPALPLAS